MHFPAIAKILLVFFGVLFLHRLRLPLGPALIGGGVLLDIWGGSALLTVMSHLGRACLLPELWLLVLNISLIMEVGHFMAARENSQAVIAAARRWGGKHGLAVSLMMIPAVIGMVPMPGGALFSAPLIGRTVEKSSSISPAWKTAVNYWFRHILEFWWPLYPVVIVTLSIFTIQTWKFMLLMIPFTFVSLATGYFFLLRGRVTALTDSTDDDAERASLFVVMRPVFIIVICTLLLPGLIQHILPGASPAAWKLLAMLIGLVTGLGIIFVRQAETARRPFAALFTRKTFNILMTLGGVMVFQAMLESSNLLPVAGQELLASRVPFAIIIGLLPFLAGLVTGIAIGFAGAAFPIVAGFVAAAPDLQPMAALVLAFSMGYAGMMLSPVHLCLVLTKEYFSAPFISVYRYILPCVVTVMAAGVFFYFLLSQ